MDRDTLRRDFVEGIDYPPARTRMRGHDGLAEVTHLVGEPASWANPTDVDDTYDLVVVGSGQSGLAAAYYFRSAFPGARILLLESQDDFGGHAIRNELEVDGRRIIAQGGSCILVGEFRPSSVRMFEDIGLDLERYRQLPNSSWRYYDVQLFNDLGLGSGIFFDGQIYGRDHTAVGGTGSPEAWEKLLADAPLAEEAKRDFVRIHAEAIDYLPDLSPEDKEKTLRSMSYDRYLREVVKVHPQVADYYLPFFDTSYGLGTDTISAWSVWAMAQDNAGDAPHWEFPGFAGLGLRTWGKRNIRGPYTGFFFPDGMAGICRLLVRWLIPAALPGDTMEDSVAARVDYSALDRDDSDVRLRLDSAVVNVRHRDGRRDGDEVEVTYVRDRQAYRVRARTCVLACYNAAIPHLVPELPGPQKEALSWAVRKPYVYATVAVRDWKAWQAMGVQKLYDPHGFFQHLWLGWPISMGEYQGARSPDDPSWVHMQRSPMAPGATARDQFSAGMRDVLERPFADYERAIRDQLGRSLAPGGFDPDRDIASITVNRYPHGYARGANELFDPEWPYDEPPWVIGRRRFGRIAIANSDAAAMALVQAAYEQAHRAVSELLDDVIRHQYWGVYSERG